MVYRKYRDSGTNKIVKEEVLPEEYPDIFEFIENNNYALIRHEVANDLAIFYDSYVEYLCDNNNPPKIVQIKAKETTCSRISKIDEKTGKANGMAIRLNGIKVHPPTLSQRHCSTGKALCGT